MITRYPKLADYDKIEQIHKQYHESDFPLPSHDSMLADLVVEDESTREVIAYGMVKLLAEPILIIDPTKPLRDRVKAFRTLMEMAISKARKFGLEQLYITVSDDSFAEILKEHYNFVEVRSKSLVLNL